METTFMYLGTTACGLAALRQVKKTLFQQLPHSSPKRKLFNTSNSGRLIRSRQRKIYELVGGRVIHLKYMAEKITTNGTFEGMYTACYTKKVSYRLYRSVQGDVVRYEG
jgi:hypothetical protein